MFFLMWITKFLQETGSNESNWKKEEKIAVTQCLWYKKAGYRYPCWIVLMPNVFQKLQ